MSKILSVYLKENNTSKGSLEKAADLLSGIDNGYGIAVSRAMNRAAVTGRAVAVSTIRQEYTIKASTVRNNFEIEKATRSDLSVFVLSKGPMLPLVQYRVSPKNDTTGANRKQVRVAVKKKGGLKPLGQSFIYRGQVFQRLGASRLPVEMKYGPAIPLLGGNDEVVKNVEKAMQETFEKRLDHETLYLLNGGKAGR